MLIFSKYQAGALSIGRVCCGFSSGEKETPLPLHLFLLYELLFYINIITKRIYWKMSPRILGEDTNKSMNIQLFSYYTVVTELSKLSAFDSVNLINQEGIEIELWPRIFFFNHYIILACIIEDKFLFCVVGSCSICQCSVLISCLPSIFSL